MAVKFEPFVILMEKQSYLGASFETAFDKKGINAQVVDISQATSIVSREKALGFLICTSADLLKKNVSVKVMVDWAIKNRMPVFAMGNTEELELLWHTIPRQMVKDEFIRPINVGEMVDSICEQIDTFYKSKRKKILAVDDSGVVLRNIKGMLEDTYDVVIANSGAMAIKYLTLNSADLILLDYAMPIVDGKQVMQMIREDDEFKDIPIIFLTGKNDTASVMEIMELKPDGYLLKSMESGMLHKAVDDFFAKHKKN